MKRHWLLRALMAGTVGLGIVAGLVRGESPAPPLATGNVVTVMAPIPAGGEEYGETPAADCGCNKGKEGDGKHHLLHKPHLCTWLHDNCDCWSHHNSPGCSSCKSECTFVFGSCRQFFGEPCLNGPPPSVIPPRMPGYVPGMPIPGALGFAPSTLPPGASAPSPFDYGAVPSSRIMPAPGAAAMVPGASNYQFMPGGYR